MCKRQKTSFPNIKTAKYAMRVVHNARYCQKCRSGRKAQVYVCPECQGIHWGHRLKSTPGASSSGAAARGRE